MALAFGAAGLLVNGFGASAWPVRPPRPFPSAPVATVWQHSTEIANASDVGAHFELPVVSGEEHWYFVRAGGPDGVSVAYLAPVWFTGI